MSTNQNKKSKFRSSSIWKKFRLKMKKISNSKDNITGKPLYKGWNLHHKDLNENNYTDITNENNFICLNKQTHDFIHWLYRYFVNDEDIINRIKKLLEEMKSINEKLS